MAARRSLAHVWTPGTLVLRGAVLSLPLLAACGAGTGARLGPAETGDSIDAFGASAATSGRVVVDEHEGGRAPSLLVRGTYWGRLVDVYEQAGDGERRLRHEDYLIGPDIASDGTDFVVETDPFTQETRVVILHPAGAPGGGYERAFERLDAQLVPVHPAADLDAAGVHSLVPRNAALVIRLNDLLDPDLVSPETVQVFTGAPPAVRFDCRILGDPNHGDVVEVGGTARFYTTRILIDTTVTELEAMDGAAPLPVNGVGLPAGTGLDRANVIVRLPTRESPSTGQQRVLRNPSGRPLATAHNGPVDFASPSADLVRAFLSGGSPEHVGDSGQEFLGDDVPPGIVGRQPTVIEELPRPDPSSADPRDFVLRRVSFPSLACAQDPRRGDGLRQPGFFAEVREDPAPHDRGIVRNLAVRLVHGDPLEWAASGAGPADFVSIFDPIENADQQGCFVQIRPTPDSFPLEPTAGLATQATFSVSFTEPIDPGSIVAFESLTLNRVSKPRFGHEHIVGRVVQSQDLRSLTFVPSLPLAHELGDEENYFLNLATGEMGPTDLAGNELAFPLESVECTLDADEASERNGGRVTRFVSPDEEPPFGDDATGPLPEWIGQHLHDLEQELVRPRPLIRYEAVADRTQPVPSTHTPFLPGVQTPLLGPWGSKLQAVWRYCDFGFSLTDLTHANVDVEGISWSPVGGMVIADHYDEFEIRLCHSLYLPDEYIDPSSLFPMWPLSGLRRCFEDNVLDPVHDPQKVVHPKILGYTVNPGDLRQTATGTLVMPYPLNQHLPLSDYAYYTWRDTALQTRGGPEGAGVDNNVLCENFGVGQCNLMSHDEVETIGLPLLLEYRCYPEPQALGLNALDVSLAANSSARPNFRAFSDGGMSTNGPVIRDPDLESCANGGFNPNSNPPGAPTWGQDNAFYIGSLDLVTRVSRSYSVWFPVVPATIANPRFHPPITDPRPDEQPVGTAILLAFRGASAIANQEVLDDASRLDGYGDHYDDPDLSRNSANANLGIAFLNGDASWHSDVGDVDGAAYYQVRVSFVSDPVSAASPELAALAQTWGE